MSSQGHSGGRLSGMNKRPKGAVPSLKLKLLRRARERAPKNLEEMARQDKKLATKLRFSDLGEFRGFH